MPNDMTAKLNAITKLNTQVIVGYVLVIYYAVGVAGLMLAATRDLFVSLMPLTLLFSAAVLLYFHKAWRGKHILVFFLIAAGGFLIEVLGVHTGQVFGSYSYGPALGVKLFETPLIIGLNWLMLIYCVHTIMEHTSMFWPLKILAAAFLMVIYDVVMEPVAISLGMWSWGDGPIPLQNYQAWFIISLVMLGMMQLAGVKTQNRLSFWLFGAQFGFFLFLNMGLRLFS